jgi:hypothetical protein
MLKGILKDQEFNSSDKIEETIAQVRDDSIFQSRSARVIVVVEKIATIQRLQESH